MDHSHGRAGILHAPGHIAPSAQEVPTMPASKGGDNKDAPMLDLPGLGWATWGELCFLLKWFYYALFQRRKIEIHGTWHFPT